MHKRTLIALLAGAAALATTTAGWTQTTPSTTGTTTSGAAAAEDQPVGSTGSTTATTNSGQTTSSTSATTDSGSGNTNTTSPTGTTTGTSTTGTTTSTDTTPAAAGTSPTPAGTSEATGTSGSYGAGSSTAAGSTGRTATLAGTDATFLRKAMEGGLEEVQRAQAAMRSAQRAEVRNVASMMLEDHRRTNEKLTQLANSKGWDVPSTAPTAESDQSRMTAGPGFDDNYLEQEIRHHRETISLFRAQSSAGSDPDLRKFAQDTLPGLEHHLEMLQGSYSSK